MVKFSNSLKNLNTFGIDVNAKACFSFNSVSTLKEYLSLKLPNEALLILGGGSNILFTQDFDGMVLLNRIMGFEIIKESENEVLVRAGAGENWHNFVLKTIDSNLGGLENLSLIPGCVGASPMQNIGAYGVEIKDVFHALEAYHISSGEIHNFSNDACKFGYRESVFKNEFKDQYVILNVTFKLSKIHALNTKYGVIEAELEKNNINNPTIRDISNAVIAIRSSKLPNPAEIGNAGSFFKNPVVSIDRLKTIQANFLDVPNYPVNKDSVKLAAGWLIEQAGWKGKTFNNYGVHKLQALVLVNYGGATGQEIYDLSTQIIQSVDLKFGVQLEREVNIL